MPAMSRMLWRDVVRGHVALALVPVAPLLLLPFILVAFVVVFPLWLTGLAVLGLLRLMAWPIDRGLDAGGIGFHLGPPLAIAFEWVKTFGGLAKSIGAAKR